MNRKLFAVIAAAVLLATAFGACGGDDDDDDDSGAAGDPEIVTGAGDITAAVSEYRNLLGADNAGKTAQSTGRREINWDGVPDELSAPNPYQGDFFNQAEGARARGILLKTEAGGALSVSADAQNSNNAPVRFGNLNPKYVDTFRTFSAERLFSPVGSNIVDATFFVPGTQTPALVRGFGAVYTDVDTKHTAFEYFDKDGKSLGKFDVPISKDGLSFLGVAFDEPIVARVRIAYGTAALGPDDSNDNDVAVMDDFIYGEPQPAK